MKREDVIKIFPEATKEQVDAILNGFGAELNDVKTARDEAASARSALEGQVSDLTTAKALLEAQVGDLTGQLQQGMSAEELLKAREAAADAKEREFLLKSNELDAKAVFVGAGFADEDIAALLPQVVSDDAERTVAAAKALVDFDARRRTAAEQAAKDALVKGNPRQQGTGAGEGQITEAAFDKMTYAEQMKAIEADPGLLKRFA